MNRAGRRARFVLHALSALGLIASVSTSCAGVSFAEKSIQSDSLCALSAYRAKEQLAARRESRRKTALAISFGSLGAALFLGPVLIVAIPASFIATAIADRSDQSRSVQTWKQEYCRGEDEPFAAPTQDRPPF